MNKLQILIPHYHESEDVVNFLLSSLEKQTCKDFNVIIINDGDDVILSKEFLSKFSYEIRYEIKEHGGISSTRNYALKLATSPYIMFCDADDMFIHEDAIKWITSQTHNFDVLSCAFMELRNGNYYVHTDDGTYIHSKVYRRKYLLDNDIWFREDIACHEDVYFVSLANCCAKALSTSSECKFYLYKENKKSITHQEKFLSNTWDYYVQSKTYLIEELLKRNKERYVGICVATVIFDTWAQWNSLSHSKKRASKRFFERFHSYWDLFPSEDKEMLLEHNMERFNVKEIPIDKFVNELLRS